MPGGTVPNMQILVGGIIVPPPLIGQVGQSLININPPCVSQVPMTNYVAGGILQPDLVQSIWAPHSQPQLSEGGNYYRGGNQAYIP